MKPEVWSLEFVQFEYINRLVKRIQRRGQPAVSVDTKEKELVGDFKNGGREYRRRGRPLAVRVHDFADEKLAKAIPYCVYDLANNEGWVSIGITRDTAGFAAATIHRWWDEMGRDRFRNGTGLLITADGGGSNGSRSRLWKVALHQLADTTGLVLTVCHFPPGTSNRKDDCAGSAGVGRALENDELAGMQPLFDALSRADELAWIPTQQ